MTSDNMGVTSSQNSQQGHDSHECDCTKYKLNTDLIQKVMGYRYQRENNRHFACGGDGFIFPARDVKVNRSVVIKIMPTSKYHGKDYLFHEESNEPYDWDDYIEIARLKAIGDFTGRGKMFCSLMVDYMYLGWHAGIIFSQHGPDLYELTTQNGHLPLLWDNVVAVAFQIIQAVNFLHANGLAHMDIKPENVVAVCGEYQEIIVKNSCFRNHEYSSQIFLELKDPRIRLVDFGSSEFFSDGQLVELRGNTAMFRAPEVILQLDCDNQCDKWSIGCTLVELYFGGSFFPCDVDDVVHLAAIQKSIGPIPDWMITEAENRETYFCRGLYRAIRTKLQSEIVRQMRPLKDMIIFGPDGQSRARFIKLIRGLMEVEPDKRIRLTDALKLPYFENVPDYLRIDCDE